MIVGLPKEIKTLEARVGLTPSGARELIGAGHQVLVERSAGQLIGFSDAQYQAVGAELVSSAEDLWQRSNLIVKVKEPQKQECERLKPDQMLFAYLHLAADPKQAEWLQASGSTCIAYETVVSANGGLPLLAPMSEIAGRLSIQAAARCLELSMGGSGLLLPGVPGVAPANVVVLGGGVVGLNAARMAQGLGARVSIFDRSLARLRSIDEMFGPGISTRYAIEDEIEQALTEADVVIGAVLVPGASAPRLVKRNDLARMKPGSVLVDVAIDQGGCFETSRPTTHLEPSFIEQDIVHYCVANMPGAVARTSTMALCNATLPYVLKLANLGKQALVDDVHFRAGLNITSGKVCHTAVAQALGSKFTDPAQVLGI